MSTIGPGLFWCLFIYFALNGTLGLLFQLAAIARLAEQGITPEPGCTVTVGRVTLEAVRDQHPVSHRYRVMRGREQAGWAMLSTAPMYLGLYLVQIDGFDWPCELLGTTLRDALEVTAVRLNDQPLAEAKAGAR